MKPAKKITIATANMHNLLAAQKKCYWIPSSPGIPSRRLEMPEYYAFPPRYDEDNYIFIDPENRKLAATALKRGDNSLPDIVVMEEVGSSISLDLFNEKYLDGAYPYTMFVGGHYARLFSVAVMSMYPIVSVTSHKDDRNEKGERIFSRDCLEVGIDVDGTLFTVFACHFKSRLSTSPEGQAEADALRAGEAKRLLEIVQERFPGESFETEPFAVIGDMNGHSDTVRQLLDIGMEAVLARIPKKERWTYYWSWKNQVDQIDHILLSPVLSKNSEGLPCIERRGLAKGRNGRETVNIETPKGKIEVPFDFERFEGVEEKVCASDHAFVFFEITLSS